MKCPTCNGRGKVSETKPCAWCKKPFTTFHSKQIYCPTVECMVRGGQVLRQREKRKKDKAA